MANKKETKTTKGKSTRRLDKERIALRKGEQQRADGVYEYRWTTPDGKRHSVYAGTLEALREKEDQVAADIRDGIKTETKLVTVNEAFDMWCDLKRGIKDNTFQNYKYMYNQFIRAQFGKLRLTMVKKSDVRRFYNSLTDGKILKVSTLDTIHNILHQVFSMAVDDGYIRMNPSENVLKELKKAHNFEVEKRKALTVEEQNLFIDFLKNSKQYDHWYPIFAVMLGTGLRVGEAVGLRWCDIDLDEGMIDINHTLIYYDKGGDERCSFSINTPKTKSGERTVPMMGFVKEAFIMERERQQQLVITCQQSVDMYTDFIFVNRFGHVQHQGTLNKAIKRIVRDCNYAVLDKNPDAKVLLPPFSCHILRHTFTTRLCEAGVNVKVIQDTLGHADISTTLNIYADVTKDAKQKEFASLGEYFDRLSS